MEKLEQYKHLLKIKKPFVQDKLKDKDYWATPTEVVEKIKVLTGINFNLDACANSQNAKCNEFIGEEQNTLITDWGRNRRVFMNPPYGNPFPFVVKAVRECYQNYNHVAVLLNADTSTQWFKVCEVFASRIYFVTGGRIAFLDYRTGEKTKGNTKPQMIAVFYPQSDVKYRDEAWVNFVDISELQE